ncbi:hypothetical protein [Bradyrhizobium sp. WSM2793]|uniref:hypothetical protein n=1 Tax=Bradyrhizobium sp. WSM2793 TaxID=1038866 RepID=UPI00036D3877|nr:hypothetical protein [Bradyrhizobium sp. WSM2793]
MTLQQCRAAFAQPDKQLAGRVYDATQALCGCEQFSMADESPGVVADHEGLCLIISDPTDIQDGRLSPTSLIRVDTSGVSVLRDAAHNDEFDLTITELKARSAAANKPRSFIGVCLFSAHTLRQQNGNRFLGVYDTALPGKPHHADVLAPPLNRLTPMSNSQHEKAQRRRIKQIIDLVGRCFDPAHSFRDGAFAKHT